MPKYTVYVTGSLDDDFEVEADDPTEAMEKANNLFRDTYNEMWSDVNTESYELIGAGDYDELDDGT